jgi:uncharacterized protein YjbI with pentapeptide repeats
MNAEEVLNRYAAGHRDFRRVDLRGKSFKEKDLAGADFSEADIRGTNFTNANLRGANFSGAKAGLRKRWWMVQLILSFVWSVLYDLVAVSSNAAFLTSLFDRSFIENYTTFPALTMLFVIAVTFWAIARQGLTTRAMMMIVVAVAATVTVVVAVAGAGAGTVAGAGAGAVVIAVTVAGAIVGAVTVASAVAVTVAGVVAVTVAVAVTVVVVIAVAVAVTVGAVTAGTVTFRVAGAAGASAVAVLTVLLSLYVARRALKGDEKFALVRPFGVAFGAMGGTSFCGADLTGANFTGARLKSTNFQASRQKQTILDQVCWQDVKKLDRARVGNSILANAAVQELLVSRNGYKKSYVKADLRGANLTGVNLNQANLQWADLSEANLQQADLREANLREALLLGTDLTRAHLTGACIEAWNIDHTTVLEAVDCQYLYLLRQQQERRPSSGDFAPGEFTKLFQEVLSTVDLIFRNGVDWKAFVAAFQQVQVENEGTELAIQSIENKGDGVVVVRVNVPPDANKEKIHSEFNQNYELALQALEAKYHAELKAKDDQIIIYRQQSAEMTKIVQMMANRPVTVEVKASAESKAMNDSTDQSRNINAGRDINLTGSTLNLGEISGNVTNTIHQLQTTDRPEAAQLADLLSQLQQAIEQDPHLPDTDKTEALEQVNTLAKAGQNPQDSTLKKLANTSVKILKGTVAALPDAAKLAEACSKLLPAIVSLLAL